VTSGVGIKLVQRNHVQNRNRIKWQTVLFEDYSFPDTAGYRMKETKKITSNKQKPFNVEIERNNKTLI
jgi:hypothetical protein